jgi:hypothetical protein
MASPTRSQGLLVHLSDIHLLSGPEQETILDSLELALKEALAGRTVTLVAITGDLFDSSAFPPFLLVDTFRQLRERLSGVIGDVPMVILPGNHDRRRLGVVGPHVEEPFQELRRVFGPPVHVFGCNTPFLAQIVPYEVHGLPLHLVTYDSTYLPTGWVSAGGEVRSRDLLHVAAVIERHERAMGIEERWPMILLLHHHLIPTPITDLARIHGATLPGILRWLLDTALPRFIANADREELMMTALGAGSALSTLNALGRAVLVMHGHKHYPTARLLRGLASGDGDVLLTSAGSAGTVQYWEGTTGEAARIWPSFNLVEIDDASVSIDKVAFSDRRPGKELSRDRLVMARRQGTRWDVVHAPSPNVPDAGFSLERHTLEYCFARNRARWNATCRRSLRSTAANIAKSKYIDVLEGAPGARLVLLDEHGAATSTQPLPARIELGHNDDIHYRVERGWCRTLREAARYQGPGAAYAWAGLLLRYPTRVAELTVIGLDHTEQCFGSITQLTTGNELPVTLELTGSPAAAVLRLADVPPLTLLRIYWPFETDDETDE